MEKTQSIYRLVDVTRGSVIATHVTRAAGWWDRLVGLMGRSRLEAGEGLLLEPCNGIHTCGMRFAIDLLVLDKNGRVLRMHTALKPWRVSLPVRGGRSVVELPADSLAESGLAVGDQVILEPGGES